MKKLVLILTLLITTALNVNAMSLVEQVKVIKDTVDTCNKYNVACEVQVHKTNLLQATSNAQNQIKYSTAILNYLPYDEMKSVAYHEIAHLILQHPHQTQRLLFNSFRFNQPMPAYIMIEHKHSNEYQADWYASYMMKLDNVPNKLDTAIQLLTPINNYHKQSISHPSTYSRVQRIKQFKQIPNPNSLVKFNNND